MRWQSREDYGWERKALTQKSELEKAPEKLPWGPILTDKEKLAAVSRYT